MTDGVYLVDKPQGMSSHDVVGRMRRILGRRDIGHAGTLDPMATGILVVLAGEATKLSAYLTAEDKSYAARVVLGSTTASLDADSPRSEFLPIGEALKAEFESVYDAAVTEKLYHALLHEAVREQQVPPTVSAIHIDGVRAYKRVARGEDVQMATRDVRVRAVVYVGHGIDEAGDAWVDVELHVGKGYYVRSFARDLATSLGTVGHLTQLRRLRSGVFDIEDALPLGSPEELKCAGIGVTDAALKCLPSLVLSEEDALRIRQGKKLQIANVPAWTQAAALCPKGMLVAVVGPTEDGTQLRVLRGFTSSG